MVGRGHQVQEETLGLLLLLCWFDRFCVSVLCMGGDIQRRWRRWLLGTFVSVGSGWQRVYTYTITTRRILTWCKRPSKLFKDRNMRSTPRSTDSSSTPPSPAPAPARCCSLRSLSLLSANWTVRASTPRLCLLCVSVLRRDVEMCMCVY